MKAKLSRTTVGALLGCALTLPLAAQAGASHAAAKQAEQNQAAAQSAADINPTAASAGQNQAAAATPELDLLQAATKAGGFNTWLSAVEKAGLKDMLKSGPYTVFAPTDEAFAKLPAGALEAILKDVSKLQVLLKNHIVARAFKAGDIPLGSMRSLAGNALDVGANRRHTLVVEGAKVVMPDVVATNGIIHGIDQVMLAN